MKKMMLIILLSTLIVPLYAQETNAFRPKKDGPRKHVKKRGERPPGGEEHQQRRLDFMAKVMDEVGVTEEEKTRLQELQDMHQRQMMQNNEKMRAIRERFDELQRTDASDEEIDQAINEITTVQAEQLRILLRHRREMEKIIGKEKNDKMMERARDMFRQYGSPGGFGGKGSGGKPGGGKRPYRRDGEQKKAPGEQV
ncbi:MAG: hypothetical protein K9M45_06160 [Kiritimatiellales bacterium]|nr:hypothetical protein [Kiritimatiellales bacterium]